MENKTEIVVNHRYQRPQSNGNYNDNNSNRKRPLLIGLIALLVVIIAIIVAVIARDSIDRHNREQQIADSLALVEKMRRDSMVIAGRCDSLYRSYQSPALRLMQLRGFAKSVNFTANYYGDDSDSAQEFTFELDTRGYVTSVRYCPNGRSDRLKCDLTTSPDGAPITISYSATIDDSYPNNHTFALTSGADGTLSKAVVDSWIYESIDKSTFHFNYDDGAYIPSSASFNSDNACEGTNGTGKGSFSFVISDSDDHGNWTRATMKGNIKYTYDYYYDGDNIKSTESEKRTITLTRSITYYAPDEIDLRSILFSQH